MILSFVDYYFLVPLLTIGIVTSYTDIKFGKIRNNTVATGLIYTFLLLLSLLIYSIINSSKNNIEYIAELFINGLIALCAGYLLWNLRLWSAGDAKLFFLYSLLLPLQFYSKSYFEYFPSLNLLANIFSPFLIVLMLGAIASVLRNLFDKKVSVDWGLITSPPVLWSAFLHLIKLFLTFSFTFLLIRHLLLLSNFIFYTEANIIVVFVIALLVIKPLQSLMKNISPIKWAIHCSIIAWFVVSYFWGDTLQLIKTLRMIFVFMVLMGGLRGALDFYVRTIETKEIRAHDIERGMILSREDLKIILGGLSDIEKERFGSVDASGLNEQQSVMIRSSSGLNDLKVKVYKTFPFAPFLLLSAVISIFTRNSFVSVITSFFSSIM